MASIEYDLRYLQAGQSELKEYLLSTKLYWPLGERAGAGELPYPHLTLDNLLFARARLQANSLFGEQQDRLARIERQFEQACNQWRSACEQKARHCFQARTTQWRNFLNECQEDPEANANRYANEVRSRVKLHLLVNFFKNRDCRSEELLNDLDRALRNSFVPGAFVWEIELAAGFRETEYWYLYGHISGCHPGDRSEPSGFA